MKNLEDFITDDSTLLKNPMVTPGTAQTKREKAKIALHKE